MNDFNQVNNMTGLYILVFSILFLLGGLLTFLHHKTKVEPPKNGWAPFEDDDD